MINEERKALYEELIEKGSWHDHENNANWRAFFYLLTSDLMRYNFNEEEFFKEPKDFPYWKKWGKLEKKIPLSSGEKAMFDLAIYLYSQGQYPFSISMLQSLSENYFEDCLVAIKIAGNGKRPTFEESQH